MTLPCRIHRTRNRNRVDSLPLALALVTCLFAPVREAISQDAVAGASEAAGVSWLPAVPIQITAALDGGYDDNLTLSPSGTRLDFHQRERCSNLRSPWKTDTIFCGGCRTL